MNALEVVLKNSKKHICIKYINGNVDKVLLLKAHNLVSSRDAVYISKSEYKKATKAQPAEVVAPEVVTENSAPKPKLKAKERKAADKKK